MYDWTNKKQQALIKEAIGKVDYYKDTIETYGKLDGEDHGEFSCYHGPAKSVAFTLKEIDDLTVRYADTREEMKDALRRRYEMRDGAALMMANVYGYDVDYARRMMMTHAAWGEYEEFEVGDNEKAI